MKRKFIKIVNLLVATSVSVFLLYPNSWAVSSEKPVVISKKIVAQTESPKGIIGSESSLSIQKRPALKPKFDITRIPKDMPDERTIPANSLLAQNTPPVYNPKEKIDPFQPLFEDKPQVNEVKLTPVDDGRTKKTALEQIDLSQLKLTGIILAASGNKGLVQESTGRGHVISRGTYIGTRGGRVTGIQKNKVIIEEKLKDLYGKIYVAEKELRLNKVE